MDVTVSDAMIMQWELQTELGVFEAGWSLILRHGVLGPTNTTIVASNTTT